MTKPWFFGEVSQKIKNKTKNKNKGKKKKIGVEMAGHLLWPVLGEAKLPSKTFGGSSATLKDRFYNLSNYSKSY
jgi:hypothetical protein